MTRKGMTVVGLGLAWALLLAACGRPAPLQLAEPWAAGEVSVLELSQRGQVIGTLTLKVQREEDMWVLITETTAGNFFERAAVWARPGSLEPTRVEFEAEGPAGRVTYTATYGSAEVTIRAQRPDGPQEATVKLPAPPYYDNEQFIALLRALPLRQGWKGTFNVIVTRAASKAQLTVEVVGKETVRTAVGDVEAWKLELKGANQFGWVEVDPPHRLVRYENVAAGTVSLLKEYRAGE